MNTKISVKDFFLHIGAIVTFYASAIALITLLFEVINYAYPKITNAYQYYFPSISFQVATLIVAFPLFLWLSWQMQRSYENEPELRDSQIRKFLSYATLFIAGAIVAGDLVTLIYTFLDGEELTKGFLLKVLALFLVAGGIFLYYLREIRNSISHGERNIWRIVAAVFIVGSIILGFMVIGTPAEQRARRYDNQRVMDLQNIQWQVVNFWQQKGSMPATLDELRDPISGWIMPTDPKTKENYEYNKTANLSFELCAAFDGEGSGMYGYGMRPMMTVSMAEPAIVGKTPDNWAHQSGRQCFNRTIDPQLYPQFKR
jgi:hypothetical protein